MNRFAPSILVQAGGRTFLFDAGRGVIPKGVMKSSRLRRLPVLRTLDKILKGAHPGDLPIEQASKWDLVVNLKTAKALGLTIPRSLMLRVDHAIE